MYMVSPILCSSRISVLISRQPDRTDTFPLKLRLSGLLVAVGPATLWHTATYSNWQLPSTGNGCFGLLGSNRNNCAKPLTTFTADRFRIFYWQAHYDDEFIQHSMILWFNANEIWLPNSGRKFELRMNIPGWAFKIDSLVAYCILIAK